MRRAGVGDGLLAVGRRSLAVEFAGKIQHGVDSLAATVASIRSLDFEVLECMVGCETGVLLGDQLSEALGVRTNGTAKSGLRRNKFLQTEAVRALKLNACGQMLADSQEDVEKVCHARHCRTEPGELWALKRVFKFPVQTSTLKCSSFQILVFKF